jgi:cytochrome c
MHQHQTRQGYLVGAALLLSMAITSTGFAADLASGADVFDTDCSDCHTLVAAKNKKGPSLFGIANRPAATVAGFANYSPALKASGLKWTADKLDAYLTNPRKFVLGGKMKYDGLAEAALRQDLIAFLQTKK